MSSGYSRQVAGGTQAVRCGVQAQKTGDIAHLSVTGAPVCCQVSGNDAGNILQLPPGP